MSFDWEDYLRLAKLLVECSSQQVSQEAYLRSAISRAYYSVFCKARNYLKSKRVSLYGNNIHWEVINYLKNQQKKIYKKIGTNLERLKQDRNDADYEDIINDLNRIAKLDLKIADEAIHLLNKLP